MLQYGMYIIFFIGHERRDSFYSWTLKVPEKYQSRERERWAHSAFREPVTLQWQRETQAKSRGLWDAAEKLSLSRAVCWAAPFACRVHGALYPCLRPYPCPCWVRVRVHVLVCVCVHVVSVPCPCHVLVPVPVPSVSMPCPCPCLCPCPCPCRVPAVSVPCPCPCPCPCSCPCPCRVPVPVPVRVRALSAAAAGCQWASGLAPQPARGSASQAATAAYKVISPPPRFSFFFFSPLLENIEIRFTLKTGTLQPRQGFELKRQPNSPKCVHTRLRNDDCSV